MSPTSTSFEVESQDQGQMTLERAASAFPGRLGSPLDRRESFLDTFDWRLYRKDGTLRSAQDGRSTVLRWNALDGTPLYRLRTLAAPDFVWDLPPGPFRTALEPLLEMRRLMPRLEIADRGRTLQILDASEKTVARLHLVAASTNIPGASSPAMTLPVLLTAEAVRGYEAEHEKLVAWLERELRQQPTTGSQIDSALEVLGLNPASTPYKFAVQLNPGMRSDVAVQRILQTLLDTMRLNEEGVRLDLDSEFLHDFRVAVRRTRSALTQIKDVYPAGIIDRFKPEFAWLGQVTGPTRDLDVYLLNMPDYRASLPPHVQPDLEPLQDFLSRHQRIEQRRLVKALDSERYSELLAGWQSFLECWDTETKPDSIEPPRASIPAEQTASDRIWKAYRRVLKRGRAVNDESPAEWLHRLRIDCKKLRYLLEFFRSLYDAEEIGILVKALKRLQDNLGDFNDLEIQQDSLRRFAHEMFQEGLATVESLMALGRLVDRLESRQEEERLRFQQEFREFASKRNRARFQGLFKQPTMVAS
jgi:CHAD domain-containing protein